MDSASDAYLLTWPTFWSCLPWQNWNTTCSVSTAYSVVNIVAIVFAVYRSNERFEVIFSDSGSDSDSGGSNNCSNIWTALEKLWRVITKLWLNLNHRVIGPRKFHSLFRWSSVIVVDPTASWERPKATNFDFTAREAAVKASKVQTLN